MAATANLARVVHGDARRANSQTAPWLLLPSLHRPTPGSPRKIKLALLTTEGVSATAVSVDTIARQVTLHGKVGSGEEKEKAESVAKKIDGVHGVRNLLQVVAPRHEKAAEAEARKVSGVRRVRNELQVVPSAKQPGVKAQDDLRVTD